MGSPEKLRNDVMNPLLGSGAFDLDRVNDQAAFEVSPACPGSNAFLRISTQQDSGGDLLIQRLEQDLALTGTVDHSLHPGWRVSGVCANGMIECRSGSWSQCSAYRWTVNSNRTLGREKTAPSNLGGCYCINNSCQGQSRSNQKAVLEHLGAGLAASLSRADPFYTISEVKADPATGQITYLGQHGGQCQSRTLAQQDSKDRKTMTHLLGTPPDVATLQAYTHRKAGGAQLKQAGQATAVSHPLTRKLREIPPNEPVTLHDCWVRRHLDMDETTLDQIIYYDGEAIQRAPGVQPLPGENNPHLCPDEPDCLELVLGRSENNRTPDGLYQRDVRFQVKAPERIVSAVLHRVDYDDWMQVAVNGQYVWSGPYPWTDLNAWQPGSRELDESWHNTPNIPVDFTPQIKHGGSVVFRVRLAVGDLGEGYVSARIKADTRCRLKPDVIDNGCQSLAHNRRCVLKGEWIDQVHSFQRHGTPQLFGGSTPLRPSARTQHGQRCSFTETRDWWEKRRTYECRNTTQVDVSRALERHDYVVTKLNEKMKHDDSLTHTQVDDRRWNERGQRVHDQYAIQLPPESDTACLLYCQTTRSRPRSDVTVSGVVADRQHEKNTVDTVYRECTEDKQCPAETGETVKTHCQCLNEFGYAATLMEIVNEAAKDTQCLE